MVILKMWREIKKKSLFVLLIVCSRNTIYLVGSMLWENLKSMANNADINFPCQSFIYCVINETDILYSIKSIWFILQFLFGDKRYSNYESIERNWVT